MCVGEVGAIFGLEVSRLARSSADLSRLLELARLTDTLVIDADGIYDLANFNDRLLLGLKGTMSEAELHFLAGRLQGAKRAAAERGELRFPLPVGFVYDDDGDTIIDPDAEVQAAVADVFAAFRAGGSAYQVVAAFKGRRFPLRAYGGVWAGQLRWGRLTHSRVLGILANPAYAGTYVFGRYHSRRVVSPDGVVSTKTVELPRDDWPVVIHDHHPGYIGWDDYLTNGARLAANLTNAGARPPREGHALCQGIIGCGSCGRPMTTRYHRNGHAAYECSASRADQMATATCRSITAATVDDAVAARLLDALNPDEIALALAAADEVADRRARHSRAAELAVERARYEAERAERAFHACEPENRLVARNLEARWEQRLAALAEADKTLADQRAAVPPLPSRAELETLTADVSALWHAPTTSPRDRKRLLRTLIADVTVLPEPDFGKARIGIRWHTGATDELVVARRQARHPISPHRSRRHRARPQPRQPPQPRHRRPAQRRRPHHRRRATLRQRRRRLDAPLPPDPATRTTPRRRTHRRRHRPPARHRPRRGHPLDQPGMAAGPSRAQQPVVRPVRSRRRSRLPPTGLPIRAHPRAGLHEPADDHELTVERGRRRARHQHQRRLLLDRTPPPRSTPRSERSPVHQLRTRRRSRLPRTGRRVGPPQARPPTPNPTVHQPGGSMRPSSR